MNPRRTTPPASEPIGVEEAKLHLRVEGMDEDASITTLIQAARETCEDRLQRTLITTGWTLTLDAFPEAIELRMPAILSVSSVTYRDEAGNTQTLPPADYEVDTISAPGQIVSAPGKTWPATRGGINNVTVVYTAGYGDTAASVPAPIRQWLLLAVGEMYAHRERSSDRPVVSHDFVDGLLCPYKVWG